MAPSPAVAVRRRRRRRSRRPAGAMTPPRGRRAAVSRPSRTTTAPRRVSRRPRPPDASVGANGWLRSQSGECAVPLQWASVTVDRPGRVSATVRLVVRRSDMLPPSGDEVMAVVVDVVGRRGPAANVALSVGAPSGTADGSAIATDASSMCPEGVRGGVERNAASRRGQAVRPPTARVRRCDSGGAARPVTLVPDDRCPRLRARRRRRQRLRLSRSGGRSVPARLDRRRLVDGVYCIAGRLRVPARGVRRSHLSRRVRFGCSHRGEPRRSRPLPAPFPIVSDPGGRLGTELGLDLPALRPSGHAAVLVSATGEIVSRYLGFDPGYLADDVLDDLESMDADRTE